MLFAHTIPLVSALRGLQSLNSEEHMNITCLDLSWHQHGSIEAHSCAELMGQTVTRPVLTVSFWLHLGNLKFYF